MAEDLRIGIGSDMHRLVPGRSLVIGGVTIESEFGAEGHSDADVLLHAVTDAILGALALGDIGTHFPSAEDRWRNAESSIFLQFAAGLMKDRGFAVANIDAIVHLERPKLRPHIDEMRQAVAAVLECDAANVSIKAKTGEGLDAVGRAEAMRADAVVLLRMVKT